jgi:hypothetical protein
MQLPNLKNGWMMTNILIGLTGLLVILAGVESAEKKNISHVVGITVQIFTVNITRNCKYQS